MTEEIKWGEPLTGKQAREATAGGPDTMVECRGRVLRASYFLFCNRNPVYRLPADHPYYTFLRKKAEHGTDLVFWAGGENAPEDLSVEGQILFADGSTHHAGRTTWNWKRFDGPCCIIAYTRKANPDLVKIAQDAATAAGGTFVKWLSEEDVGDAREAWDTYCGPDRIFTFAARHWGLLAPEPTEAERIAQKTGVSVEAVQAVLDARGEG